MFGYSNTSNVVFILRPKEISSIAVLKVKVDTKLLRINDLTHRQWKQLKQLQGRLAVSYLKLRYGSPNTYILLAYVGEALTHVEWIVPASRIKSRYHFVSEDSYSIISCLTAPRFRGLGIYPSQIQKVVQSIRAKMFWIWTVSTNTSSLEGIRKAGGMKAGELVQKKWFWGYISHIEYFPEGSDSKWQ